MADAGLDFTEAEIQYMLDHLDEYSPEEQAEIEKIADVLMERMHARACQDDLIEFCKHMQPDYKVGKHHRILADLLMDIAAGGKDRICVNMPPRHGKSQLVSIYFPAWFMGKYPTKKVLMVSHTTDLAVDFGRKVRNIIDTVAYQQVFSGVKLASDSKSAGRWNTSAGGEYFACIRRTSLVSTQRGYIPAGQVRIGDTLYNSDNGVTVQEIYDSQHPATYTVAGLECSDKHPIWTINRGWVYASDLVSTDILTTESILDRMKVLLRRIYGYLEHTYVSALVQHKVSLHQPQQREMGKLRGAGCYVMRTVARVREFFTGHGAATNTSTYCGEGGQQRPLQPGELPMGRRVAAAEQQAHQQGFGWAYVGATCTGYGYDTGSHSIPQQQRDTVGGAKTTEEELRAYGHPNNLGWTRHKATQFLTRSSQSIPRKHQHGTKGYMARVGRATQELCGLLLGVRRVGEIEVTQHDTPKHFVNFLTSGNHTFFADGVLTHNCGVGSALAGRGADLLLIDDPHNEQDIINGNFEVFEKAYEWFTYGARTRLMPGGRVAIVQCMTGDTPVLMGDGTEKLIHNVAVGDTVATFDNGVLRTAKVVNHKSNGMDCVYTIKTTCGKIVRANERHPFLVVTNGELRWVRLKNLWVGDFLVSLKAAPGFPALKQNLAYVGHANLKPHGIEKTRAPHLGPLGIGVSTKTNLAASKDAQPLRTLVGCASRITTKLTGLLGKGGVAQTKIETPTSSIDTESRWRSITRCWTPRTECVQSVNNPLQNTTLGRTGITNFALTTATLKVMLERFYATIATSLLGTSKQRKLPWLLQNTSDFTLTQIVEIAPAGEEEVFDIQVEGTENFIANGLVSHNTRWHQDDLTGRVVRDMTQNELSDQYEVVEFPAIIEVKREVEGAETIVEKPLWPEFFDLTALHRTKASMPVFQWNAQYQQNPTSEEASIIKREWWNVWEKDDPPKCEYIIMALDAAAEAHNRADFTALTTWGVFFNEERDGPGANAYNIILLNSIKKRVEFPELKELATQEYREWEPDSFIVEKKSSGTALYQELRRTGIPVGEYTPHRGSGDKMARLNSVADIVRSSLVWVPQTRWAEELVEEIAGFPFSSHDDLVDSTVMALMRFRQGGFIRLPSDEPDEIRYFKSRRHGGYY